MLISVTVFLVAVVKVVFKVGNTHIYSTEQVIEMLQTLSVKPLCFLYSNSYF